ncbi:MAG: type III-B CRISPR module RAMP protein Cmr6 [Saprospiraceae bacterium]|nr:type III-B CRISPR module RAMP protein Cmr6 [Saprospiraceae bacterium]
MSNWQNYNAPNLGLLFYKRLYQESRINQLVNLKVDEKKGDSLIFKVDDKNSEFNDFYQDLYKKRVESYTRSYNIGNNAFTLFTTYPGLLVGSGYAHSTKTKGDATIGFFFDHTLGLPVVPGSSVKGVLRSLFEIDVIEDKEYTGTKSLSIIQFIIDELMLVDENKELFVELRNSLNEKQLNDLKQEIFGDEDNDGQDVFFDSVIDFEKTPRGMFIGSDYITPHQPDLLKNPTPLQFLKVLPDIGFKFRFNLKDGSTLKAKQKMLIFHKILLTLGIGAKTNVGYGQLISEEMFLENQKNKTIKTQDDSESPEQHKVNEVDESLKNPNPDNGVTRNVPMEIKTLIKKDSTWDGIIKEKKDNKWIIEIKVSKTKVSLQKAVDKCPEGLEEGNEVIVRFNADYKDMPNFKVTSK